MNYFSFCTPQGITEVVYCEKITLPVLSDSNAIYIADANTLPLLKHAENFSHNIPIAEIRAGEEQKNFSSVQSILEKALKNNLNRSCIFIGFGGGVICDLTAFAASIYMRGVRCKLVPTTLLAMTDAAVGGKTAVNFSSHKNIAGTFFKAEEIYISAENLKTLNDKEYFSGLAEVIKIALLNSKELYEIIKTEKQNLLNRSSVRIQEIIKLAVSSKAAVIEKDFYEKNERVFLNFGHTFAHALEAFTNFSSITHGEAVAWGIGRALELGRYLNKTDFKYAEEVISLLNYFGWDIFPFPCAAKKIITSQNISEKKYKNFFAEGIISKMRNDKKNKSGNIKIIMQENLNCNFLYEAEDREIRQVLI